MIAGDQDGNIRVHDWKKRECIMHAKNPYQTLESSEEVEQHCPQVSIITLAVSEDDETVVYRLEDMDGFPPVCVCAA